MSEVKKKIISLEVRDEYILGSGVAIGAQGSFDSVWLRIKFNETWAGLNIHATWTNALGEEVDQTIITAIDLVDGKDDTYDTYDIPVPQRVTTHAGTVKLALSGYVIGGEAGKEVESLLNTVSGAFRVLASGAARYDGGTVKATEAERLLAAVNVALNSENARQETFEGNEELRKSEFSVNETQRWATSDAAEETRKTAFNTAEAARQAEFNAAEAVRSTIKDCFQFSTNLYDESKATVGKLLRANGKWEENASHNTTDYIPVSVGETLTVQYTHNDTRVHRWFSAVTAYDASFDLLEACGSNSSINEYKVPEGVAYIRGSIGGALTEASIVSGTGIIPYEPYKLTLKAEHHDTDYIEEKITAKVEEATEAIEKKVDETKEELSQAAKLIPTRNLANVKFQQAGINQQTGVFSTHMRKDFIAAPEYVPVKGGTTYTFSWSASKYLTFIYVFEYKADYEFIKCVPSSHRTDGNNGDTPTFRTTSFSEDCAFIRIEIVSGDSIGNTTWDELILEKLQLEEGETRTDYISPLVVDNSNINLLEHPDAKRIARVDDVANNAVLIPTRNLANVKFQQAGINQQTGVFSTHMRKDFIAAPEYVPVEGGKNYTLSWRPSKYNNYVYVYEYKTDYTYIKWTPSPIVTNSPVANYTIELDTDCAFIRVVTANSDGLNTTWDELILEKFQIEKGVVATPYIPPMVISENNLDLNGIAGQMSSSTSGTFNYSAYGLPVLEFIGSLGSISKENAVTLNYKYGDREGTCTLKYQGSSSMSYPKKNYTVKFDTAFEALEGWGEQKKYCLKANFIDFSHARNICSAKLWGTVVKSRVPANENLNALPNGGAIDGFPICVVINGEYKGIYTFNIPKDGWMFGMGDGDAEAIVCADNTYAPACKFTGEATLDGDFEVEYAPDEDNIEWIKTSLNRLLRACVDCNSEEDFENNVAPYLDVESAIDYFIFASLICHNDGISKNYILATYDGVKWFFSAYDMDSTFGLFWEGTFFYKYNRYHMLNFASSNRLFNLLKTYKADELKARYNELIKDEMSEETITETFINFIGKIPKAMYDEEVKLWSTLPSTSVNNVSQIIDYYHNRRKVIDAQIEAL